MYHLICKFCHNPFERNRNTLQYCCRRCAYDDRIGQPQHPNAGKKKTKKPTQFICKYCNSPFERMVYPSKLKVCNFDFCSFSCRAKGREWNGPIRHHSTNWKTCPTCGSQGWRQGEYCREHMEHPSRKRKIAPYIWSKEKADFLKENYATMGGKEIANVLGLDPSQVINKAGHMKLKLSKEASHRIIHSQAQKYMKSPKNPNWKGGKSFTEFGENWIDQRKKALKRDNCICQNCFGPGRTVHHIMPRRLFKVIEHSNVLSNLITVCSKCHVPIEIGKIRCPIPLEAMVYPGLPFYLLPQNDNDI